MQKKNVESFDDSFDERASKSIGKSFPKFVDGTQRAEANGSPLLFASMGTLPIEFSTKTPSTFAVQKKKYGAEWPSMYKTFSDRYYSLYGFESSKGKRASELAVGGLSDDDEGDDGVDISALAEKDRTPKRKAPVKTNGKRKSTIRKGYNGTAVAEGTWRGGGKMDRHVDVILCYVCLLQKKKARRMRQRTRPLTKKKRKKIKKRKPNPLVASVARRGCRSVKSRRSKLCRRGKLTLVA